MKNLFITICLFLFACFMGCRKDTAKTDTASTISSTNNSPFFVEYRNQFAATYKGLKIQAHYSSSIAGYPDSTENFIVVIQKSTSDDSILTSLNLSCPVKVNINGIGRSRNCSYPSAPYQYSCRFVNDSIYYYNFSGNSNSGGNNVYFRGKKQ